MSDAGRLLDPVDPVLTLCGLCVDSVRLVHVTCDGKSAGNTVGKRMRELDSK